MKYFCKESSCGAILSSVGGLYVCPVCNAKYSINFQNKPIMVRSGIKQKFLQGDKVVCTIRKRSREISEGVRSDIKRKWLDRYTIKEIMQEYDLPYTVVSPVIKEVKKKRKENS